jgi:hypothetical protein
MPADGRPGYQAKAVVAWGPISYPDGTRFRGTSYEVNAEISGNTLRYKTPAWQAAFTMSADGRTLNVEAWNAQGSLRSGTVTRREPPAATRTAQPDRDLLDKLRELRRQGVLSDDQYDAIVRGMAR